MIPILRTQRLTLRPHGPADAEPVARYLNNFAIAGNLATVPYPYRRADADWWLGQQRPDPVPTQTAFAIDLPGAGYIGNAGFHLTDDKPELGYWLAQPFWHRGFMTEAATAVVGWYFDTTDGEMVHCGAFAFNKASLAVQKKLGFTETGISRRRCLARNEEVRHIDTQLNRSAWAGGLGRAQNQWAPAAEAEHAKDST
jgi:RimJ/RimL family protein N-acetyltransferase